MLKCRDLLKQGIWWKLGRGDKMTLWFDNWMDNCNLIDLLNIQAKSIIDPNATVGDFINHNKSWNVAKLNQVVHTIL